MEMLNLLKRAEGEMEEIETLKPLPPPDPPAISAVKIKTSVLEDDLKIFKELSSAPNWIPANPLDRIKIYISGSTYALFAYDSTNRVWRYCLLT